MAPHPHLVPGLVVGLAERAEHDASPDQLERGGLRRPRPHGPSALRGRSPIGASWQVRSATPTALRAGLQDRTGSPRARPGCRPPRRGSGRSRTGPSPRASTTTPPTITSSRPGAMAGRRARAAAGSAARRRTTRRRRPLRATEVVDPVPVVVGETEHERTERRHGAGQADQGEMWPGEAGQHVGGPLELGSDETDRRGQLDRPSAGRAAGSARSAGRSRVRARSP